MKIATFLLLGSAAALAACSPAPEKAATDQAEASDPGPSESAGASDPQQPANQDQSNGAGNAVQPGNDSKASQPVVDKSLPAALHGRWGMVPGDCTSTRGDAKGLILVDAEKIRFYESVARPSALTLRSPTKVQGSFAFSGEGSTWSKDMSWSVTGGTLTRIDGPEGGSFTYKRCS